MEPFLPPIPTHTETYFCFCFCEHCSSGRNASYAFVSYLILTIFETNNNFWHFLIWVWQKKNLHHLAIAMRLGKHISPGHKHILRCRIIRRLKNMYHALGHMFLHTSMFYAQPSAPVAKDSNWMSIHNYQPHAAPYDFLAIPHTLPHKSSSL